MHDAGYGAAVLGSDDEHVPAAAIGDDLFLQVAGGFAPAKVGLERRSKPRALLPQAVPNGFQLRARLVDDLAGRGDLRRDVGAFSFERGGRIHEGPQARKGMTRTPNGGARRFDRSEESRKARELQGLERASLHGKPREHGVDIGGRIEWKRPAIVEQTDRFGRGRQRQPDLPRVGLRAQVGQALPPERRQRQPRDGIHNTVVFEGPQGTGLHVVESRVAGRRKRLVYWFRSGCVYIPSNIAALHGIVKI